MNRLVVLLQRTLVLVVLVVSGVYALIYLARWEWNRAIVCGLFFVASEVVLATSLILGRLRDLEARTRPSGRGESLSTQLRESNPPRSFAFRWLRPDRPGVFVPVLLGAGVVLSALAYLVERIAQATAAPLVDRTTVARLSALQPPREGLLHPDDEALRPPGPARPSRVGVTILVSAVAVSVAVVSVLALRDATQSRPDPPDLPATTTLLLDIDQKRARTEPVAAGEALWIACRAVLGGTTQRTATFVERPDAVVEMTLSPGLGTLGTRRLEGCLSDLTLPLVRARVLDVEDAAAPASAGGGDDAAVVEVADLPRGQPEDLGEHLVGVLAEQRRR